VTIEYRWAEGKYDRLPELTRDLCAISVDIQSKRKIPCFPALGNTQGNRTV